jgi:hypothetical protein
VTLLHVIQSLPMGGADMGMVPLHLYARSRSRDHTYHGRCHGARDRGRPHGR